MATPAYLEASSTGFKDAQAYDAHRPSYPPQAVQSLLGRLGLVNKPNARIIDLAAGTGKFTELLAAREEQYEVLAVEPTASMRETLAAKKLGGVEVRDGTAEEIDVEDGWADGVVAAQAFHWFANEKALAEIRRVLKPGGKLAVIWNIEDYNQPAKWTPASKWEQTVKERILELHVFGPPRFRDDAWGQVFDRQAACAEPLFSTPLSEEKHPWTVWLGKEALWDRVNTLSQVYTLEGEEKAAFRKLFDEAVTDGQGEFNGEGEVALHGVTYFAWTARL